MLIRTLRDAAAQYQSMANDARRATLNANKPHAIIPQAEKENVEDAALAFAQLTINFVDCRKTLGTIK